MKITKISNNTFEVILEDIDFTVTLDNNFHPEIERKKLIEASFKFLLDREPKESILKSFNLKIMKMNENHF